MEAVPTPCHTYSLIYSLQSSRASLTLGIMKRIAIPSSPLQFTLCHFLQVFLWCYKSSGIFWVYVKFKTPSLTSVLCKRHRCENCLQIIVASERLCPCLWLVRMRNTLRSVRLEYQSKLELCFCITLPLLMISSPSSPFSLSKFPKFGYNKTSLECWVLYPNVIRHIKASRSCKWGRGPISYNKRHSLDIWGMHLPDPAGIKKFL